MTGSADAALPVIGYVLVFFAALAPIVQDDVKVGLSDEVVSGDVSTRIGDLGATVAPLIQDDVQVALPDEAAAAQVAVAGRARRSFENVGCRDCNICSGPSGSFTPNI